MQDGNVIVASYLLIGLTEEDILKIRVHFTEYAKMFFTDQDDPDLFSIDVLMDSVYPCITLKVAGEVWERFSRSHDLVELNVVMAQDNILGVLH